MQVPPSTSVLIPHKISRNLREISRDYQGVFPKCCSYSVEGVDEGGWPQKPKIFFLKIALLQMPTLRSWSGCQPVLLRAGCTYSCRYPYIPIDITLTGDFLTTGWDFRDTRYAPTLPDKHTSNHSLATLRYIWKSEDFLPEYLESVLPALDTSKSWWRLVLS